MSWVVFGSSGHLKRPPGGVLKNYWRCLAADTPHDRHVKVLANTRYALGASRDPHTFRCAVSHSLLCRQLTRRNPV